MTDYRTAINRHYGAVDIAARILEKLSAAGVDLADLRREDLAPFDEFHGGGLESTRRLARFAGVEKDFAVLDLGAGVGGPARTLAAEFGCRVTGIDLTEAFVEAARMLTERLGMAAAVEFHRGSVLDLPFEAGRFDLAWSQNSIMNIEDKGRLFTEVRRVLKPGGRFAFELLCAGRPGPLRFPTFWASTPELSFLVTPEEMRRLLHEAGLEEIAWQDTTEQVVALARKRVAALERDGPPALGLAVIVPEDVPTKMQNVLHAYERGLGVAVQAVYRRH